MGEKPCAVSGSEGKIVNRERGMKGLITIRQCRRGATAIEYALVASLIAVAAIVGMRNLGGKMDVMFNNVSNAMP